MKKLLSVLVILNVITALFHAINMAINSSLALAVVGEGEVRQPYQELFQTVTVYLR